MYVVDKQVATDLAREFRRLAGTAGIQLRHSGALECVAAGFGFSDVNALTARLRRKPLLLDIVHGQDLEAGAWTPFHGPIEVTEQIARLLRFIRRLIRDADPAVPWMNASRVTFDWHGNPAAAVERFDFHRTSLSGHDFDTMNRRLAGQTSYYLLPHDPAMLAAVVGAAMLPGGFHVVIGDGVDSTRYVPAFPDAAEILDGRLVIGLEPRQPADGNPFRMDFTVTMDGDGPVWSPPPGHRLKSAQMDAMTGFWGEAFSRVVPRPADGTDPVFVPAYVVAGLMVGTEWLDLEWTGSEPSVKHCPRQDDGHLDRRLLWTMLSNAVTADAMAFRLGDRVYVPRCGGGVVAMSSGQGIVEMQPGGGHYRDGKFSLRATPMVRV